MEDIACPTKGRHCAPCLNFSILVAKRRDTIRRVMVDASFMRILECWEDRVSLGCDDEATRISLNHRIKMMHRVQFTIREFFLKFEMAAFHDAFCVLFRFPLQNAIETLGNELMGELAHYFKAYMDDCLMLTK